MNKLETIEGSGYFIEIHAIGLNNCKAEQKTEHEYGIYGQGSRCSIHWNPYISFLAFFFFPHLFERITSQVLDGETVLMKARHPQRELNDELRFPH